VSTDDTVTTKHLLFTDAARAGVPDVGSVTSWSAQVGPGEVVSRDPELRNLRLLDIAFAESDRGAESCLEFPVRAEAVE